MYCTKCGGNLQDGAAFCGVCGLQCGGVANISHAPVYIVPQAITTTVRDFRCNNCGTPLKIPTNSNAPVRCPSCKTECVIERAIRNAEIAAKENIESGIPLSAAPAALHRTIVGILSKSSYAPIDIFDRVEVISEEHYCVPAHVIECNGTEGFNYEVGNAREQVYTVDRGSYVETRTRTNMEFVPSSGMASVRKTIIAPGNRKLVKQFQILYGNLDPKKLVDIEDMIFPADINTVNSDISKTVAFNEFAVSTIENELKKRAKEQISQQVTTGLRFGGSSIQKEFVRIFLGMYRIVFRCDDKEYTVWVNGDGSKWHFDGQLPEDLNRKQKNNEANRNKEIELSQVNQGPSPDTGRLTAGLVIGIIVGVLGLFTIGTGIGAFLLILGLATAIILGVLRGKEKSKYSQNISAHRASIEAKYKQYFDSDYAYYANSFHQFKARKQALRGIYQGVSGDVNAF